MDGMTMDLFADTPDAAAPPAAVAPPELDFAPVLEAAFADAGRKAALKALEPEQRSAIVAAIAVVAHAKRSAYDRAVAGEFLDSFARLTRQPALADATALLNRNFIDSGVIPMAPAHA